MDNRLYDDGWESQWNDMKVYGPFARHLRRLIHKLIAPLKFNTLLDLGCGEGSLLREIHERYPWVSLTGADISEAAIKYARQHVPDCDFHVLDVSGEYLNRQFDLVICSEVLEHISDDLSSLQNINKMTSLFTLISTPQGRMRNFEAKDYGHVRNYAPGELVDKIKASGFKPINIIQWGFPFYSPLYRNFIELVGTKGASGKYGIGRKTLASLLYALFFLNSSQRGDEIIVLARKV